MIPPEMGELEEERLVMRGASSLPVTKDLENPDNLDMVSKYLFLLHRGKCLGRTPGQDEDNDQKCIESCMFARFSRLRDCAIHYESCAGATCTEPHCAQSVALVQHWDSCVQPTCFICSTAVNLIIDNFCSFLGGKGDKYSAMVAQIQGANLAIKKAILRLNISVQ